MRSTVLWLLVLVLALTGSAAHTCSDTENNDIRAQYQQASKDVQCAQFATTEDDNSIKIQVVCGTFCIPTLMKLADNLPDCDNGVDGINRKKKLQDTLFNKCAMCTPTQKDEITGVWKTAADSPACARFAIPGVMQFTWPCSATNCTAIFKDLAYKVPACYIDLFDERKRIQDAVNKCPDPTTVAPTPAPKGGNFTFSSTKCTATEIDQTEALYWDAAVGSSSLCTDTGTTSASMYSIIITAPCSSTCVSYSLNYVLRNMPDCFNTDEGENKKASLKNELVKCDGTSPTVKISVRIDSKKGIKAANPTGPTIGSSAMPWPRSRLAWLTSGLMILLSIM